MRRVLLSLASLLFMVPIAGSTPPGVVDAASAPRPLLWKLSDADNSVYLLGSFHLLKAGDYPVSPDIDAALGEAETVVFEVRPEEMTDPALPMTTARMAMDEGDAALAQVVPQPLLDKVRARLDASGLPSAQFERFEPWFVSIALVSTLGQSLGFSGDEGLDVHLMARAAKLGKRTGGLETVQSQLAAMDSTPIAEQVESLRDYVEGEDVASRLNELHAAWRGADVDALERLARREMAEKTPETYRLLNIERNRAWLPQVEAMLARGSGDDALVVVGALHLIGEDGLVEQLRSRGYRIERVCSACAQVPSTAR